jgi:cysteinyl-tRNA synthetase
MIDLIRRLEERGFTYSAGGNVYYDIEKFGSYGEMARLDREGLRAGARIEVDEEKRNPHDFALWFTRGKFEQQAMVWDSPWGRGYPGWHLECSAMSMKYLGDRFDIHCGGVDHINVHHTNEIAQTEGATGTKWVNFWMHGEFLVMETSRMGKSVGNAITLTTLTENGYEPLDYRYYLLGAHYRTQLSFTWKALDAAKAARASLGAILRDLAAEEAAGNSPADEQYGPAAQSALSQINEALCNDLNVPQALGLLRTLLRDSDVPAGQRIAIALDADRVFGMNLAAEAGAASRELPDELASLITEREQARKDRDFGRADELRDRLQEKGVLVEDTPTGTKWKWGQL